MSCTISLGRVEKGEVEVEGVLGKEGEGESDDIA